MINVLYYHVYKCLINNTATLIDSYKTHKLTPLIKSYKTICTHLSQYILSINDKQVSGQPIFTPNYSNNSDKVIIYCILCLASVIYIPSKGTEAKSEEAIKHINMKVNLGINLLSFQTLVFQYYSTEMPSCYACEGIAIIFVH